MKGDRKQDSFTRRTYGTEPSWSKSFKAKFILDNGALYQPGGPSVPSSFQSRLAAEHSGVSKEKEEEKEEGIEPKTLQRRRIPRVLRFVRSKWREKGGSVWSGPVQSSRSPPDPYRVVGRNFEFKKLVPPRHAEEGLREPGLSLRVSV